MLGIVPAEHAHELMLGCTRFGRVRRAVISDVVWGTVGQPCGVALIAKPVTQARNAERLAELRHEIRRRGRDAVTDAVVIDSDWPHNWRCFSPKLQIA
jgi:hypothetical protein